MRARNPVPLVARARRQVEAGADALDVNVGQDGTADDLTWAVRALRDGGISVPLWLDAATTALLGDALGRCRDLGPIVANALPMGDAPAAGEASFLTMAAGVADGLVISPHLARAGGITRRTEAAAHAIDRARAAGFSGDYYVDALALPARSGIAAVEESLEAIRQIDRDLPHAVPLAAVGNVAHGLPAEVARAVRSRYAAAARHAGARALILPVEDPPCVEAARTARAPALPSDAPRGVTEAWHEATRLLGV